MLNEAIVAGPSCQRVSPAGLSHVLLFCLVWTATILFIYPFMAFLKSD